MLAKCNVTKCSYILSLLISSPLTLQLTIATFYLSPLPTSSTIFFHQYFSMPSTFHYPFCHPMLLQSSDCHPMFCQSHSVTPTFIWCSIQSAAADHIRLMHITRLLAAPFSSRKRLIDFLLYRNKIFYVANIRQNCNQQQKWYNLYSVVVPKLNIPSNRKYWCQWPRNKRSVDSTTNWMLKASHLKSQPSSMTYLRNSKPYNHDSPNHKISIAQINKIVPAQICSAICFYHKMHDAYSTH